MVYLGWHHPCCCSQRCASRGIASSKHVLGDSIIHASSVARGCSTRGICITQACTSWRRSTRGIASSMHVLELGGCPTRGFASPMHALPMGFASSMCAQCSWSTARVGGAACHDARAGGGGLRLASDAAGARSRAHARPVGDGTREDGGTGRSGEGRLAREGTEGGGGGREARGGRARGGTSTGGGGGGGADRGGRQGKAHGAAGESAQLHRGRACACMVAVLVVAALGGLTVCSWWLHWVADGVLAVAALGG